MYAFTSGKGREGEKMTSKEIGDRMTGKQNEIAEKMDRGLTLFEKEELAILRNRNELLALEIELMIVKVDREKTILRAEQNELRRSDTKVDGHS